MADSAIVRPPFPRVFDSSMLGYARACHKKFFWRHILDRAPKGSNLHLLAGGAFAKGLEAARLAFYYKGLSVDESICEGQIALVKAWGANDLYEEENKSLGRMLGGLDFTLLEAFPLGSDYIVPYINPSTDKPMVECSFGIPIDVLHPETGDPIIYAGRFDMLGVHKTDAVIYVEDDKTTSQLGASWASKWTLRSQFTGYVWGAQQFGLPVAGAVVRGISFLSKSYDKAESIQQRPKWMVERWYEQTCRDIQSIIAAWQAGQWDYNFDESCAAYGGCPYIRLCDTNNPDPFLDVYYDIEKWDPLRVKEVA